MFVFNLSQQAYPYATVCFLRISMYILFLCAAPGAGEGTSSGGDPTHPPRKKRARVDPTVESVSSKMISGGK